MDSSDIPPDECCRDALQRLPEPGDRGSRGGYVCGQCFHVVEPNGYAERRAEGVKKAAEERRIRTEERRARSVARKRG
ncbi:hypothetical protein GCM10020000_71790 [Streptomyces olivoverticillatus]